MSSLLVQDFLLKHSLEELREHHGVRHSLSSDGTKVSLNYHQIEAREDDTLACECRGLILAKYDRGVIHTDVTFGNSTILAFPFKRFFNFGQQNSQDKINLDSTLVWEKVDGTLCIVYYDGAKWNIATRSVPEADVPIDGFMNYTFANLFKKALLDMVGIEFDIWSQRLSIDKTYIFELMTPINRVVVQHHDYKLNLLGMRSLFNHAELGLADLQIHSESIGIPLPQIHHNASFDDLIKFVNSRKPDEFEGVVLCDQNFNRLKIKSQDYVAFNKVHDIVKSPVSILRIILDEKLDDYVTYLPAHAKQLAEKIANDLHTFVSETDIAVDELMHTHKDADRKTVALYVQNHQVLSRVMSQVMRMWAAKQKEHMADWILSNKNSATGCWEDAFLKRLLRMISPNLKVDE